ncbi:class I adenylate-forming enzyme family protein [Halosolutus gelatinilyticus]|uniref:class I adenylate-forming enzyme family protein n=1 Tax=Halosolutus gelatinilyticus TaxID=2931975 RepID=UPI001FF55F3D|nr:class I adenylate-forming enzyme family protein [Halosolutus gelatinilyticus]
MNGEPVAWPTRDLLSHRAATTPDRTAIVDADAGAEWTYGEFDRRVDSVAGVLAVREDDRLGVLLGTRPAFAAVYFAAMRRGATVVPLNVRETVGELRSKVRRIELDAIVCESATEGGAAELANGPVVSVDEPERDGVSSLRADTDGDGDATPVRLDRDRTHLLMFTSGTSGEPKVVRLTLGNLVASATASAFRLGVLPDDRWLCCLPMYHMGGLAPVVRSTLYGTTVVIQREFDPEQTARAIDERDISGVSLVPTMLTRLLDAGWTPPESLRFVLLGGAPASRELIDRCCDRGVPVHPTYGMTETASQIATARPEDAFSNPGTVGRPLVCTDVSIVDESGELVDPGERGVVVVSGPTVTPGYLDPDRTAAAFGERGLRTGDVGYRDETGRLWITGRVDDRIVTGGENVDPDEVVAVLREHQGVAEAAVVGLPDEEWGQRVAALVAPDADGPSTPDGRSASATEARSTDSIDVEAVLAHCDDRLAGFKRPKTIGVVGALPRTPSGTVDRDAVRERLLAEGVDVTESD